VHARDGHVTGPNLVFCGPRFGPVTWPSRACTVKVRMPLPARHQPLRGAFRDPETSDEFCSRSGSAVRFSRAARRLDPNEPTFRRRSCSSAQIRTRLRSAVQLRFCRGSLAHHGDQRAVRSAVLVAELNITRARRTPGDRQSRAQWGYSLIDLTLPSGAQSICRINK
jgi:hypothetical protein